MHDSTRLQPFLWLHGWARADLTADEDSVNRFTPSTGQWPARRWITPGVLGIFLSKIFWRQNKNKNKQKVMTHDITAYSFRPRVQHFQKHCLKCPWWLRSNRNSARFSSGWYFPLRPNQDLSTLLFCPALRGEANIMDCSTEVTVERPRRQMHGKNSWTIIACEHTMNVIMRIWAHAKQACRTQQRQYGKASCVCNTHARKGC